MPHGHCFLWLPEILWLHVISDIVVAVSYFAIPLVILLVLWKRNKRLPYPWAFTMFGIFIFLCGATHIFSILTLWRPYYFVEGILKALTAAVSFATATMVIPLAAEMCDAASNEKKKR